MSQSPSIAARKHAYSRKAVPALRPMLRGITEAMMLDLAHLDEHALRQALFPVTRRYAYLNHAAVSPPPLPVVRAMTRLVEELSAHGSVT